MEDAETMRQMVIAAVNECQDIELLDLIYRILNLETSHGGEKIPAFILFEGKNYSSPTTTRAHSIKPNTTAAGTIHNKCNALIIRLPPYWVFVFLDGHRVDSL